MAHSGSVFPRVRPVYLVLTATSFSSHVLDPLFSQAFVQIIRTKEALLKASNM